MPAVFYLYLFFLLLASTAGIISWRYNTVNVRAIIILTFIVLIIESTAFYLNYKKQYLLLNHLYHFYTLIEFTITAYAYSKEVEIKERKAIFILAVLVLPILLFLPFFVDSKDCFFMIFGLRVFG